MATIDADAHVVESEHTWDYMDPAERKYRPILVSPHGAPEERPVRSILDTGSVRSYWLIDGKSRGTQQAGAGVLMIGTDYGHQDMSVALDALRTLGERGDLDPVVAQKIVDENPRALYGL